MKRPRRDLRTEVEEELVAPLIESGHPCSIVRVIPPGWREDGVVTVESSPLRFVVRREDDVRSIGMDVAGTRGEGIPRVYIEAIVNGHEILVHGSDCGLRVYWDFLNLVTGRWDHLVRLFGAQNRPQLDARVQEWEVLRSEDVRRDRPWIAVGLRRVGLSSRIERFLWKHATDEQRLKYWKR